MPSCIVRGCTYSWYKKDPNITLHSFPRDLDTIKAWLLQTKQDFGNIDEFSQRVLEGTKTGIYRICSQHFTADSYERCGLITYVKKGAVPTIFPAHTPGTNPSQNKPVAPKKRKAITVSLPSATEADLGILQPFIKDENYAGAIPFTSAIHLGTMSMSDRKKKASNVSKRTIGTCTEYYPGQVHRKTNTDPFWGTKNKEIQCCKRKPHRSIGLQCNLGNLPPLVGWGAESQTVESLHDAPLEGLYMPAGRTPTKDPSIVPLVQLSWHRKQKHKKTMSIYWHRIYLKPKIYSDKYINFRISVWCLMKQQPDPTYVSCVEDQPAVF